jgi:hypothetical protein
MNAGAIFAANAVFYGLLRLFPSIEEKTAAC